MFKQIMIALTGAATIGVGFAGSAEAASVTLGEIWAGDGTLSANGIIYSNFLCNLSNSGTQSLSPTSCNDIEFVVGNGFDLEIVSLFEAANTGNSAVAFLDALISFDAMFDDSREIEEIGLSFDSTFEGLASASVTETARDPDGNIIGQLKVTNSGAGSDFEDPDFEAGDFGLLYSVSKISITKDIFIQAGPGSSAAITSVGQTYSKDDVESVPEPASLLGLAAIAGIGFASRRKLAEKA
jgi:hypothetical protein